MGAWPINQIFELGEQEVDFWIFWFTARHQPIWQPRRLVAGSRARGHETFLPWLGEVVLTRVHVYEYEYSE